LLGHFYLTKLLLPTLIKSNSRIINLTSIAHSWAKNTGINYSLISNKKNYNMKLAYGMSKLANIYFTQQLQIRYGSYITAYSVHPGVVESDICRYFNHIRKKIIQLIIQLFFAKTCFQGAQVKQKYKTKNILYISDVKSRVCLLMKIFIFYIFIFCRPPSIVRLYLIYHLDIIVIVHLRYYIQ
jgi:NAD(P)-dependent dehydrogenase (short-subunit alcohol dehydrogenase family)